MEVLKDLMEKVEALLFEEVVGKVQEEHGGNLVRRLNHMQFKNYYPH